MKAKKKTNGFNDETEKAKKIVEQIFAKGGWENQLGLPGWRWFQFDTRIDARNFFVSFDGMIKAGDNFSNANEIVLNK